LCGAGDDQFEQHAELGVHLHQRVGQPAVSIFGSDNHEFSAAILPRDSPALMKTPSRVALLIESSRTHGRGVLRGIARYTPLMNQSSLVPRTPSCLRRKRAAGVGVV